MKSNLWKLFSGSIIMVAGIIFVIFGSSVMQLSNIFISYYSTNPELANNTNPTSNIVILTEVKKQTFEKINSDGLAVMGMGLGLVIGGIPFLTSWGEDIDRVKTAKKFITIDFKNINDNIINAINAHRQVLSNNNSLDQVSENLTTGKMNRLKIISTYYRILYFPFWNVVITDLKEIYGNEMETLQKLHMIITRMNLELETYSIQWSRSVDDIVSSKKNSQLKKNEVKKMLQNNLQQSLDQYQGLYNLIRNEVMNVEWIDTSDWLNSEIPRNTHFNILGTPMRN